jgi:hypothetical protein
MKKGLSFGITSFQFTNSGIVFGTALADDDFLMIAYTTGII